MRLIKCSTLQLEEFFGSNIPPYAVLSHTWGNEEVSFADYRLNQATTTAKEGYRKIALTSRQALQDGLDHVWIDTCCIDKSSSSELSEAINSMFCWYRDAIHCYVYLSDVSKANFREEFPKCRWFTRGWTLQELLAPTDAMFYDRDWDELGTKSEHADWISDITAIDVKALIESTDALGVEARLDSFCVAKRMSWASRRETTRTEDMAYCLLGVFNINIPLLYGEGERAFLRLQEEIMKNFNDDSILAWGLDVETRHPLGLVPDFVTGEMQGLLSFSPILASSPKDFKSCGVLEFAAKPDSAFTITNLGLKIQLPLVPVLRPSKNNPFIAPNKIDGWIGLLSCSPGTNSELLGLVLFSAGAGSDSCKEVGRAQIWKGEDPCHTFVVGLRAALQSTLKEITIIREEESLRPRGYYLGYRQIVINELQAFQNTGYHVIGGTGLNIAENRTLLGYRSMWNPATMTLTIEGNRISKDLLSFCFEPQWSTPGSEFTVFMRTASKRTIIRKGSSFSEEAKHKFYDYLEDRSHQDDTNEMTFMINRTTAVRIIVTLEEKRVYNWRIFEVNIDAAQLHPGVSEQKG